jgi:hypothetical protein
MKKLIIILFMFNIAFAQDRGDNTLLINTSMDGIENLLLINFYEVERIDSLRFTTKPKAIQGSIYAYNLQVSLSGVIIDGQLMVYATNYFEFDRKQYSSRSSFENRRLAGKRLAFDEMVKVFSQLNLPITFKKLE